VVIVMIFMHSRNVTMLQQLKVLRSTPA